jgi:hypothetical protein
MGVSNIFSFFFMATLILTSVSLAESKRMYRYTDSKGKSVYVRIIDDIPAQFRSSASAVILQSDDDIEEKGEEKASEVSGDAVRTISPMKFFNVGEGRTALSTEVRNFGAVAANDVNMAVIAKMADGKEKTVGTYAVVGHKGEGQLEAGELARINIVFNLDFSAAKSFGCRLSWQSAEIKKPKM